MHRHRRNGYRPVVVSDGCCPTCSRLAPLRELSELVRVHGGTLVLDLSQSLGLWGEAPSRGDVYGLGGGGAARHAGVRGDHVVTVASLSKSFAAPLAVACGPAALIARLRDAGSRLHASPPAAPSVLAARRALDLNARLGRSLRRRLAARVIRFKRELSQRGIETVEGLHPVQLLAAQRGSRGASAAWAERVAQRLHAQGVRALVLNGHERRPRLAFALSARHSIQNVVAAADALNVALGRAVVF